MHATVCAHQFRPRQAILSLTGNGYMLASSRVTSRHSGERMRSRESMGRPKLLGRDLLIFHDVISRAMTHVMTGHGLVALPSRDDR